MGLKDDKSQNVVVLFSRNNVHFNTGMTYFLLMCKLRRITHKTESTPNGFVLNFVSDSTDLDFIQFVSDSPSFTSKPCTKIIIYSF